jgi:hypothetical protein
MPVKLRIEGWEHLDRRIDEIFSFPSSRWECVP